MSRTVHIVDDDPGVRDSISLLLRVRGYTTREYDSGEAFLDAVDEKTSGCVVLDHRIGTMNGLQVQEALRQRRLGLPVIVLTAYGDAATARAALKAGAFDFLEKLLDADVLLPLLDAAIRVEAGGREMVERHAELRRRIERLTPRERQVFDGVVAGWHNREIARSLDISPRTVEVYKARMMEKLGVQRLPDLIRLAIEAKSEEPGPTSAGKGSP